MKALKYFLDPDGNMNPNSWDIRSVNPTTFNVAYYFLWEKWGWFPSVAEYDLYMLNRAKWDTNGGEYRTIENDDNPRFSLDESISIAASSYLYGHKENLKKLKLFRAEWSFYRPDVFCYILLCKAYWLKPILYPFIAIPAIWSCAINKGKSGDQLVLIKCHGAKLNWLFWLCSKLTSWTEVFDEYYPEPDHPSRLLAHKINWK